MGYSSIIITPAHDQFLHVARPTIVPVVWTPACCHARTKESVSCWADFFGTRCDNVVLEGVTHRRFYLVAWAWLVCCVYSIANNQPPASVCNVYVQCAISDTGRLLWQQIVNCGVGQVPNLLP